MALPNETLLELIYGIEEGNHVYPSYDYVMGDIGELKLLVENASLRDSLKEFLECDYAIIKHIRKRGPTRSPSRWSKILSRIRKKRENVVDQHLEELLEKRNTLYSRFRLILKLSATHRFFLDEIKPTVVSS